MELHVRVTVPAFLLAILSAFVSSLNQYFPLFLHDSLGISASGIGIALLALTLVGFVLVPVLVIPFGFWSGLRVDVSQAYGSLVGLLLLAGLAGSVVGGVLGIVIAFFIVPHFSFELNSLLHPLVFTLPTNTIEVILGGFTGAAIGQFRTGS